MKNTNLNSNKKFVNAYRLAQIKGTGLSISDFKDFLGNVKELSFGESSSLVAALYTYMNSQPIMDFQFMGYDVPYLTVLVDKLNEEINIKNKEGREINFDLLSQRDAIIFWVDYILFNRNLPAFSFGFKEAQKVYVDYKNSRNSLSSSMAA